MSVVPIDAGEGQGHVKYERLVAAAKQVPSAVTIVVHPCDEASLRGVCEAAAAGIIKPVLVGPAARIKAVAGAVQFRYLAVPDRRCPPQRRLRGKGRGADP